MAKIIHLDEPPRIQVSEKKLFNENHISKVTLGRADYFTQLYYLFWKRTIDILGSAAGLILSSPIILMIALFMQFEEFGSSIFFVQERIGKDGKPFKIYKVRSMYMDAEERLAELQHLNEIKGAMFKIKNDPRITKIGKFIRKYSLDELPQLWNVLKGDMSLVGPRPPLTAEVAEYSEHDLQRLLVRPGCTGLWQVCGRNEMDFDEMVELDIQYITHRSISLDILIITRTFGVMVHPNGAY
ncbi:MULTISPECIES: sugar transferase [unclassified Enterococcus]|jgi:lipopolysaccharide/colanic/teichoic acid biosynthesis glycosyltransferase|uniref:sugar transferase n=1 Tax=unclassified Enterococcus TaxID=2608891 RepID=UPI0003543DB5|nr:putative undecaprenyl-phosphate galactose phosphotransferase [Enterococcus faecalis 13-SD-W-01]